MTSGYIQEQRASANSSAAAAGRISSIVKSVRNLPDELLPPEQLMNIIGSYDKGHFLAQSTNFFEEFVKRGRLGPAAHVLDIGSGCGRMAFPFELYLDGGRYYGIDVWDEGIKWSSEFITARSPHMEFHLMEAENNYYFDSYKDGVENSFSLPFVEADSLDFVFAISVFTHLLEHDSRSYFKEIARCLKKGATAFITGFIIDHFFWQYVNATGKHKEVKAVGEGVFQAYAGQDFFGGYSMAKWREMLQESGLSIICYETGAWANKPGARGYQDTFIVVRTDTFPSQE